MFDPNFIAALSVDVHRHWPIPGQYVSAGLLGIIYHKIGKIFDSLKINLKRTVSGR